MNSWSTRPIAELQIPLSPGKQKVNKVSKEFEFSGGAKENIVCTFSSCLLI